LPASAAAAGTVALGTTSGVAAQADREHAVIRQIRKEEMRIGFGIWTASIVRRSFLRGLRRGSNWSGFRAGEGGIALDIHVIHAARNEFVHIVASKDVWPTNRLTNLV
jgi:hypothetical protein